MQVYHCDGQYYAQRGDKYFYILLPVKWPDNSDHHVRGDANIPKDCIRLKGKGFIKDILKRDIIEISMTAELQGLIRIYYNNANKVYKMLDKETWDNNIKIL